MTNSSLRGLGEHKERTSGNIVEYSYRALQIEVTITAFFFLSAMRSLGTLLWVVMAAVVAAEASPQQTGVPAVPPPVQVSSGVVRVVGGAREGRVIEVGADGIPIIHGVRVPDDPVGTPVYRNARIVNNKLLTAEDEAVALQPLGRSMAARMPPPPPPSPRQARVLSLSPPSQVRVGGSPPAHFPNFYLHRYHNNERSGVVAEDSFEEDSANASSEQVVSYSYLAAPQGHSKDVVYGSGSAAKPPSAGHTFSARSPTLGLAPAQQTQHSGHVDHSEAFLSLHHGAPATLHPADPSHFIIRESTFQSLTSAQHDRVPLGVVIINILQRTPPPDLFCPQLGSSTPAPGCSLEMQGSRQVLKTEGGTRSS
ncbi:hypothetical protein GWK47_043214 [Chionoecetes opilio]|uniref:Uncharacterized protein n=1 Tax=Chionoecetes opilio TaxID=41210 RepID=A0A8J5CJF2_CHIOP|nr:hypothetical protein GWK47_043214 [Chionoecetes opilio]